MVNAIRYYEDLVFLRMVDVFAVGETDDSLDVEIIEDVVFVTFQTTVFHIEKRFHIERSDVASAFHSHGKYILIINGFRCIFVTYIFSDSKKLTEKHVWFMLLDDVTNLIVSLGVIEISALKWQTFEERLDYVNQY